MTSYNHSLVTQATMANFDVAWIFIDVGSSVNILFWAMIERMGIGVGDLQIVNTPLWGSQGM